MALNLKQETKTQSVKSIESNTARLIDTVGELSTAFDLNGQEVDKSCGVAFQNNQYLFGGNNNQKQILQIDDCRLVWIDSLKFDHRVGACASTDSVVVLCFNDKESDAKRCRQAPSPNGPWTELAPSTHDHRSTSIANSPGNSEIKWLLI